MSYSATELRRFLEELDRNLTRSCELVVIGGAAGALMYGVTTDPDVLDDKLWIVVDDLFRTETADAIHARVKQRRRGG